MHASKHVCMHVRMYVRKYAMYVFCMYLSYEAFQTNHHAFAPSRLKHVHAGRSVILLLSHNKSGSVGLVLNKHSKLELDRSLASPELGALGWSAYLIEPMATGMLAGAVS